MKKINVSSAAAAAVALSALFSSAVMASETSLSFNVGAVSDYRYRGISQSNLKPVVQGGLDYSHSSGFYAGAWASGIKWLADSSYELDVYGGYKGEISPGMGYDVGVLRYQYPDTSSANTTEIYGALSYSMFTAKYSHATTNLFGVANSKKSGYLDLSANFDLGNGLILVPHVGRQVVKNNSASSYTDYSVSLSKELSPGLSATASYIDTNADKDVYVTTDGKSKPTGSGRFILGVKYGF